MNTNSLPTKADERDVAVLKAEIKAYVASFDAMRTSYTADLDRLREIYLPTFKTLLNLIKTKKQELEELTGKKVKFNE